MPTPAELLTSGEPILQDDELYKSGMLTAKAWAGFLALFATGTGGGGGGGGSGDPGDSSDAVATSDTGSFSLTSLSKRELARRYAPRITLSGTSAVTVDILLDANVPAGQIPIVTWVLIQNRTGNDDEYTLEAGNSGGAFMAGVTADALNAGIAQEFNEGEELEGSEGLGLTLDTLNGESFKYWVRYYLADAGSKLSV